MKNKNALGKASLVLAFIAVAYYIVITVLGLFPIVNNVIYGFGHGEIALYIMVIIRYLLEVFKVGIYVLALCYVLANKKDFSLVIKFCIIYHIVNIIDYIVVFFVSNDGNTFMGVVRDHYLDVVIVAAWIILLVGKGKMANKVVFATTRIGIAVAAVSDNAYFVMRNYLGSAYEEARIDRMAETFWSLVQLFIWVIMLVIFVVFLCWPQMFEKTDDDPRPLPSSSEEKQQ